MKRIWLQFRKIVLVLDCLLLMELVIVWIVSYIAIIELGVTTYKSREILLEFYAANGAFYIGHQRFGLGAVPFFLPAIVLVIWPLVALVYQIRRRRT